MKVFTVLFLIRSCLSALNPNINLVIKPTDFFTSNTKIPYQPDNGLVTVQLGNLENSVYEQVDVISGKKLSNRGEAHVTVITPPEFQILQTGGITNTILNTLAIKHNIQNSKIVPLCIGKDKTGPKSKNPREVYNIVLQRSIEMLKFRIELFELYSNNGGLPELFDPLLFLPHITLSFLKGDIFIQDGIFKSRYSCIGKINDLAVDQNDNVDGQNVTISFNPSQTKKLDIPTSFFNSNKLVKYSSQNGLVTIPMINDLKSTRIQLNEIAGVSLADRGETHVTVLSPSEFAVLKNTGVSQNEIDELALKFDIQNSDLTPICLGIGRAKSSTVYNIVLEKPVKIMNYRRALSEVYQSKGGAGELFNPDYYYPHITLGFVKGDLFDTDGVYKGVNSCFRNLRLI
ncbi:hypothetical protein HDV02_004248 [Globomyces sp. JEL0801]|nr:hypothetical protein HDV02_004248 [Globomyces sp. JEL0801]